MARGGAAGTETHLDLEEVARKVFFEEVIFGQVLKDHLVLGGKSRGLRCVDRFCFPDGRRQEPSRKRERKGEGRGEGKKAVTHRELQMVPSHRDGG